MVSPTMLTYLPIMAYFIPFRLTFVRPNEQLQMVFIKKLRGNIWPKIAAPSSTCVWITASFPSRITPQNIDNLKTTNQIRLLFTRESLSFEIPNSFPEIFTHIIPKSYYFSFLLQNCFIFLSFMNLFKNSFNFIATKIPFCSAPITNVAIIVTDVEVPSNHEESAPGFFFNPSQMFHNC